MKQRLQWFNEAGCDPIRFSRIRDFIETVSRDYDSKTSLLGNQDISTYDRKSLKKYFRKLGDAPLHSYRESIAYAFFLMEVLEDYSKANKIVSAVLNAQIVEEHSPDHGQFLWYLEEKGVRDRNGNFFIGAVLYLLLARQSEHLTEENSRGIESSLRLLYPVLAHERDNCSLTYVNPTLGVHSLCYLLSCIVFPDNRTGDGKLFAGYVDFLLKNGLNESYTPTYYDVDMIILFMVILTCKETSITRKCWDLLDKVVLKEKSFFAERFPAPFKRGYNGYYRAVNTAISTILFGYSNKPHAPDHKDTYSALMLYPLTLLVEKKYPKRSRWPKAKKPACTMRGVIFGDCTATSYLGKTFTLGSMNYYPPSTSVWQTVGVGGSGWQDGPFFLATHGSDEVTGILRLEAVDHKGREMTHPYRGEFTREKASRIYPFISFPPEPKVRTLQHKSIAVCLYKIDRIHARLRRFGFNLLFARFKGEIYLISGKRVRLGKDVVDSGDGVVLSLPSVWVAIVPLARVDMGRSALLEGSFTEASLQLFATDEGLNCSMYNYDASEAQTFVQDHVSGGFIFIVRERNDFPDKNSFFDYMRTLKIQEEWRNDHIHARVDKRDSIRCVSVSDSKISLELAWDHALDKECLRRINGKNVVPPQALRQIKHD